MKIIFSSSVFQIYCHSNMLNIYKQTKSSFRFSLLWYFPDFDTYLDYDTPNCDKEHSGATGYQMMLILPRHLILPLWFWRSVLLCLNLYFVSWILEMVYGLLLSFHHEQWPALKAKQNTGNQIYPVSPHFVLNPICIVLCFAEF